MPSFCHRSQTFLPNKNFLETLQRPDHTIKTKTVEYKMYSAFTDQFFLLLFRKFEWFRFKPSSKALASRCDMSYKCLQVGVFDKRNWYRVSFMYLLASSKTGLRSVKYIYDQVHATNYHRLSKGIKGQHKRKCF